MFYYARLNNNNVCVGFASYPTKMKEVEGLVPIPDYNESLLYKKWDGTQWSEERFEPEIPMELQSRIESLEDTVQNHEQTNNQLSSTIQLLEGTIAELMGMLATMGGSE